MLILCFVSWFVVLSSTFRHFLQRYSDDDEHIPGTNQVQRYELNPKGGYMVYAVESVLKIWGGLTTGVVNRWLLRNLNSGIRVWWLFEAMPLSWPYQVSFKSSPIETNRGEVGRAGDVSLKVLKLKGINNWPARTIIPLVYISTRLPSAQALRFSDINRTYITEKTRWPHCTRR